MKSTYEIRIFVTAEGEDGKPFDSKKFLKALQQNEENSNGHWFIGKDVVSVNKYIIEVNEIKKK